MSIILSIDPGIRACGAALFTDGKLAACALISNPRQKGHGLAECLSMARAVLLWVAPAAIKPSVLVAEFPQVYQRGGGRTKGDPNDLLPLAAVDGAIAAFLPVEVHHVLPAEWKGQAKKEVIEARVKERLDDVEMLVVRLCEARPSLMHNVWDAIAIGLYHLDRLDRHRVFARE